MLRLVESVKSLRHGKTFLNFKPEFLVEWKAPRFRKKKPGSCMEARLNGPYNACQAFRVGKNNFLRKIPTNLDLLIKVPKYEMKKDFQPSDVNRTAHSRSLDIKLLSFSLRLPLDSNDSFGSFFQ